MGNFNYRWMVYLIATVILATICIQVYWNYKNYLVNKQQLINEVQIGLDNAVDTYYETLAQLNTVAFAFNSEGRDDLVTGSSEFDSLIHRIDISSKGIRGLDSLANYSSKNFAVFKGIAADTLRDLHLPLLKEDSIGNKIWPGDTTTIKDTVGGINFRLLTSKVMVSITQDTLELGSLDTLFLKELERKNIQIPYGLVFDPVTGDTKELHPEIVRSSSLFTESKSSFLPKSSSLKVFFPNIQAIVLKRILGGILISTLLVLAVIGALFYLLGTIKRQKQLAEMKNDFISNITHEFKTPIATINAALEGITDFNVLKNPEKAKSYIGISQTQLAKLDDMVEKLLETASFDHDGPTLVKREEKLVPILQQLLARHQLNTSKSIEFLFRFEETTASIDIFHFENAVNNIVDNAIKYGGNLIGIELVPNTNTIDIVISDNGNGLTAADKDKIFEKFHRVPKGNVHDVKGYGIGLYHAKKIIEKHGGQLTLHLGKSKTIFKISIPNE